MGWDNGIIYGSRRRYVVWKRPWIYIYIYIYMPVGKRHNGDNGKGNMWIHIERRGTWEGVCVA